MQPKVTVIVPVYNTEATLARTLDSVLRQTLRDFEVVIVDDGTPDNAGAIADEYAQRDARVTVIHQENRGPAEARKAGQRAARGLFRMHLDSDDTLPSDALEILYNTAVKNNCQLVYSGFNRIEGGKAMPTAHRARHGIVTGREMADLLLDVNFMFCANQCFSHESMWLDDLDAMFPPHEVRVPAEDMITNINLVLKAQRVALIDTPTYNYYFNPMSLTSLGTLFRQDLFHAFFDEFERVLERYDILEQSKAKLDIMKLHYLGFYLKDVDTSDPWVKPLLNIPRDELPRKYKVMQALLPHNALRRTLIEANRKAKRLLSR